MTDTYTRLVSQGLGKDLAKRLGLPQPAVLRRHHAGPAPRRRPRPGPGSHARAPTSWPPRCCPGTWTSAGTPYPRKSSAPSSWSWTSWPARRPGKAGPDRRRLAARPRARTPGSSPFPGRPPKPATQPRRRPGRAWTASAVPGQGTPGRRHGKRHPARRRRPDHEPEHPGGAAVLPVRPLGVR